MQNVCLAAHDKGLGTCQSTTLVRYPGLLRELLPGSEEQRMVVAVTLGYPDPDAPANTFARSRRRWTSSSPGSPDAPGAGA